MKRSKLTFEELEIGDLFIHFPKVHCPPHGCGGYRITYSIFKKMDNKQSLRLCSKHITSTHKDLRVIKVEGKMKNSKWWQKLFLVECRCGCGQWKTPRREQHEATFGICREGGLTRVTIQQFGTERTTFPVDKIVELMKEKKDEKRDMCTGGLEHEFEGESRVCYYCGKTIPERD